MNDAAETVRLRRLWPPGPDATLTDVVAELELDVPEPRRTAQRPRVLLNMVSSVDGRATVEGRSAPLSSPADRALFHALRAEVDAVMVGAGTLRVERYGRLIREPAVRRDRERAGRTPEPLACVVSRSLALSPELPLLAEPQAHVAIITAADSELPAPPAARIEYVRAKSDDGSVDLVAALALLSERFGVRTLLGEGGPHLNASLLEAGLVDDLLLTVAPVLVSGLNPVTISAGPTLAQPMSLELIWALASGSQLFLRYGARDGAS